MTKSRYHDLKASLSKGSGASSLLRKYKGGGLTPTELNAVSMAGSVGAGFIDKATTDTTTDVNGVQYYTQDAGSAALSGAMKGASMGAALGPWGALAGGLAFGAYGAVTANKQNKEVAAKKATALNEATINAEELAQDNLTAARAMGFNSKGGYSSIYRKGGYISKYPEGGNIPWKRETEQTRLAKRDLQIDSMKRDIMKGDAIEDASLDVLQLVSGVGGTVKAGSTAYKALKSLPLRSIPNKGYPTFTEAFQQLGKGIFFAEGGAIPNPEYEVEGEEVVQGQDTQLEGQEQLASDMHKAVGPTHENGGVMGAGGERVFSDRISVSPTLISILSAAKIPVKKNATYASVAEKLGKLKGKYEEKTKSHNSLANRTGKVMNERIDSFIELTFQDQEFSKQIEGNTKQFAEGGKLPNWDDLGNENYVPDNSPVRVANADKPFVPRELPKEVVATPQQIEKQKAVEQIVTDPATNQSKKPAKATTTAYTGGIHDSYSIGAYATAPDHERIVNATYKKIKSKGELTEEILDSHMGASVRKGKKVPFTAKQVITIANQYGVEPEALAAIIQTDSSYGTEGKGARTFNPGNVGNDDSGRTVNYKNWDAGLEAAAKWLAKHKKAKKTTPVSSNATQNNTIMKFAKGGRIKKYNGGGGLPDITELRKQHPTWSGSDADLIAMAGKRYGNYTGTNNPTLKSRLKPDLLGQDFQEGQPLIDNSLRPDLLGEDFQSEAPIGGRTITRGQGTYMASRKPNALNTGKFTPPVLLSDRTISAQPTAGGKKPFVGQDNTGLPPVAFDPSKKTNMYNLDAANPNTNPNFANDFFTGDQAINLGVYMANLNNAGKRKTGYNREVARPSYMRRNNMLPYNVNQIKSEANVVNKGIDRTSGNVQDVFARKAAVYANTTEAINNATAQQMAADNQVYNINLGLSNDYRNRKAAAKNADTEDRIINENAIMTNKQSATNAWLSGVMGNLASKRSYDVEKSKLAIAAMDGKRGTSYRSAKELLKNPNLDPVTKKALEEVVAAGEFKKGGYIKRKGGYK